MSANVEMCHMLDFRRLPEIPASCQRVYFGHETCERLLPEFDEVRDLLGTTGKRGLGLTFVTPFLTERGLEKVRLFLEQLKAAMPQIPEIVTSDWGLMHWIAANKIGIPVAGRFIVGQQLDFRHAGAMSPGMADHLSSCTLMKEGTMEMLRNLGVNRFELSNVFHPIILPGDGKYHCSLHLPLVPLTIFRSCPEALDFNNINKSCNARNCPRSRQKWSSCYSKCDIYRMDNALYYGNPNVDSRLAENKRIDRIVSHGGI